MLLPAPDRATSCCWPIAVRSTRSNQFVFAFSNRLSFFGKYVCTAVRNCAAFSIEGSLVTDAADTLPLYSTCGRPCPDFVVMSTTPLEAFAP
ncbi:MAG: hypothetical protein DMD69_02435 [Gemmatimonadetes bacterium]|nr:MAG: hypothetical protein DMD69_02435 [Gemmatimonadota bacterium]